MGSATNWDYQNPAENSLCQSQLTSTTLDSLGCAPNIYHRKESCNTALFWCFSCHSASRMAVYLYLQFLNTHALLSTNHWHLNALSRYISIGHRLYQHQGSSMMHYWWTFVFVTPCTIFHILYLLHAWQLCNSLNTTFEPVVRSKHSSWLHSKYWHRSSAVSQPVKWLSDNIFVSEWTFSPHSFASI